MEEIQLNETGLSFMGRWHLSRDFKGKFNFTTCKMGEEQLICSYGDLTEHDTFFIWLECKYVSRRAKTRQMESSLGKALNIRENIWRPSFFQKGGF